MTGLSRTNDHLSDLARRLARAVNVHPSSILPFVDFQEVVTAFLNFIGRDSHRLLVAGHASPETEIAADRAGMTVKEALGFSPFVGLAEDVLEEISSPSDTVYLANPNTVTGCNFSFKDIDLIAAAIPDGKLIVDERFFDFYGISAIPLLEKYSHLVVLRSLTAGFGLDADTSGFLVGSRGLVGGFNDVFDTNDFTNTRFRILNTTLVSEDARTKRLAMIHDESLRLAHQLTRQAVQNRITSADFILLRVADPAQTGNFAARYKVTLTNLDGYPELKHYMRYRIQSPLSNDNLIEVFRRMPKDYYHLKALDKRAVLFRKPSDTPAAEEDQSQLPNDANHLREPEVAGV